MVEMREQWVERDDLRQEREQKASEHSTCPAIARVLCDPPARLRRHREHRVRSDSIVAWLRSKPHELQLMRSEIRVWSSAGCSLSSHAGQSSVGIASVVVVESLLPVVASLATSDGLCEWDIVDRWAVTRVPSLHSANLRQRSTRAQEQWCGPL